MTYTSRGGAPKHDGNCTRNGVLPPERIRAVETEQSNSTALVDDRKVVKN